MQMRLDKLAALMLMTIGLGLAGCAGNGDQPANSAGSFSETLAQTRPVEILDRASGSDQNLAQPDWRLIKTEAELKKLGFSPDGQIDFANQDMIILALGEQNTGGHQARITGVQQVGQTLYAQARIQRPGENQAVTQQITYPYTAVIVPETNATRLSGSTESGQSQGQNEG
jgi:hypothetical protein